MENIPENILKALEIYTDNKFPEIKPYDIVQVGYDKEFRYICNDECEVVGNMLHINEDPYYDIEIPHITEVWREVDKDTMKCIWRRDDGSNN